MGIVVKGGYTYDKDTRLTVDVANNSVVFSNGSTVYHLTRGHRDLVLTDANARRLLTLHPKTISLHKRWEGYGEGSKPIFTVCKSSMVGRSGLSAKVFFNPLAGDFKIEGSFEERRFTVKDIGSESEVAEILMDGRDGNDVFLLYVKAGFDSAFAVAIVVVLREIGPDPASP